jgi:hypothetical protein
MIVLGPSAPDEALRLGVNLLRSSGVRESSRNGPVLRAPSPVTTVWDPERSIVSLLPVRNANPFFHLMEALWMLAGRRDLAFVSEYASQMKAYSDDGGETQPGAYGYRWRHWFGTDQLLLAIEELRSNPSSRRVVLAMWDGAKDLRAGIKGSSDVPCNTHVYLSMSEGQLHMMVSCRSNDMVWGAYGSNIVHFSILQEFIAAAVGVKMGKLHQVSYNFHAYEEREDTARLFGSVDWSAGRQWITTERLCGRGLDYAGAFLRELESRLDDLSNPGLGGPAVPFLDRVAAPMQMAWRLHKAGQTEAAIEHLGTTNLDWFVAGRAWLRRRLEAKAAKEAQA